MSLHSRTFGDFSRETRERRLLNIRRQIHGGSYATRNKLDVALDRMIDAAGFTSHPPVARPDDAAIEELMDRLCETDR